MNLLSQFDNLYSDLSFKNLSDLDNIYHSDIIFEDPVTTHKGLSALNLYFANLLQNTEECKFIIHQIINNGSQEQNTNTQIDHVVVWTMYLRTHSLNKGEMITLQGTSLLSIKDDKIIYQKDYYDLGTMVYEHIPVLGFLIKKIKRKLAGI